MKISRSIALLLAALVALSAFAGCGGQTVTDGGGDVNGGNTPDGGGEETPAPVERKLVITDTFYPQYTVYDEYDAMKKKVEDWFFSNLEAGTLFSVECGEDGIEAIRSRWEKNVDKKTDENGDTVVTAVFEDKGAKIKYTLEGTLWHDYPAVDYVVWAENVGTAPSAVIKNFRAVDSSFEMPASKGYMLHTSKGSEALSDDFEPVETVLSKGCELTFTPYENDGRSTTGGWPYFDVIGKDCGIMLAIGWTGTWRADFASAKVGEVGIGASQMHLNASLFAGEKIRSPRIVLEYFDGDFDYGHNLWRKLVIEHYTPNDGSKDRFVSPQTYNSWGGVRESGVMAKLGEFFKAGIVAEALWLDAGWYADYDFASAEAYDVASGLEWTEKRGWYEINKKAFPSGSMKRISDLLHENGSKLLLWWMIEDGMSTVKDKFSLGADSYYKYTEYHDYAKGDMMVLDLSRDEVLEKLIAYFDRMFEENGVDWVRIDNGDSPHPYWVDNDARVAAENGLPAGTRLGVTENKHILNYYRLWDELAARHPGFVLDNCASGGKRLDIEMTMRGVPIWRTDYDCGPDDPEARQAQTQWLAYWIPLSASGVVFASAGNYAHRSNYSSSCSYSIGVAQESMPRLKEIYDEMRHTRPYWYGSFYALLTPTASTNDWNAYELFREDWQKGMAVVIRRGESAVASNKIRLKGLIADRDYLVHNIDDADAAGDFVKSGAELMEKGLSLSVGTRTINVYEISMVREEE